MLHKRGAFLLEGKVEQDHRRRFSFLVERISDLQEILASAGVPTSKATAVSRAFLRAKGRGLVLDTAFALEHTIATD